MISAKLMKLLHVIKMDVTGRLIRELRSSIYKTEKVGKVNADENR